MLVLSLLLELWLLEMWCKIRCGDLEVAGCCLKRLMFEEIVVAVVEIVVVVVGALCIY